MSRHSISSDLALAGFAIALGACGDNAPLTCELPEAVLPAAGDLIDPYQVVMPGECVDGGLRNTPGRWFVRDPSLPFAFDYPRIEDDCVNGVRRTASPPDDHDLEDDDYSRHTWSDGTRLFERTEYRYALGNGSTGSNVTANVYCMLPDDRLAATYITQYRFGADDPYVNMWSGIGTRFARKDEVARGLELVGELKQTSDGWPIPALNLIVDGGFAYVVGWLGLDIVDVSDPAAPVHVGHLDGTFNDIRVVHTAANTYAIVTRESRNQTLIIDVTTPSAPAAASVIEAYSHSLQIQERDGKTELYLANYEDYVPVYDVTNPLIPIALGNARVPRGRGVHDLTVEGDRIYVNDTTGGFVAIDRSTGFATTTLLGQLQTSYSHASWLGTAGGRRVLLHGDEGMTGTADGGAFMRVVDGDPSSPTFMTEIGRYQSRPEVGIHNIEMHGDRAYIAYYQDGVRVVDLNDPTQPREVAHFNTWDVDTAPGDAFEGAVGIRRVDGLIYVADSLRGLVILREN
jgi:hypothetical protein